MKEQIINLFQEDKITNKITEKITNLNDVLPNSNKNDSDNMDSLQIVRTVIICIVGILALLALCLSIINRFCKWSVYSKRSGTSIKRFFFCGSEGAETPITDTSSATSSPPKNIPDLIGINAAKTDTTLVLNDHFGSPIPEKTNKNRKATQPQKVDEDSSSSSDKKDEKITSESESKDAESISSSSTAETSSPLQEKDDQSPKEEEEDAEGNEQDEYEEKEHESSPLLKRNKMRCKK